jgi:hypothetical protein
VRPEATGVRRGDDPPLCPTWCTDHLGDPSDTDPEADSWHSTWYIRVAGADLNMSAGYTSVGTRPGRPRIFGLAGAGIGGEDGGESVSLVEAEQLAWTLLGMVAAAKREGEQ